MRIFVIYFLSILLVSCSSKSEKKNQPTNTQTKVKTKQQKAPEKPKIEWPQPGKIEEFFSKYGKENPETKVKLSTRLGDIIIQLYEDTPIHRANFIHNIKRGLYEKTIFYRVVPKFMIQGGNSDFDKTLEMRDDNSSYYIPNECKPNHIHKRGAIAMAMSYTDNPKLKSAQYSYYIVIGDLMDDAGLDATEKEYDVTIPEVNRKVYRKIGGTPHLDGVHTVFGEVIEGMDVVEAIANENRDSSDWPVNDVIISYEVLE